MSTIDGKNLNSFKVAELREICVTRGLDSSGTKKDMVSRLKAAIKKEEENEDIASSTEESEATSLPPDTEPSCANDESENNSDQAPIPEPTQHAINESKETVQVPEDCESKESPTDIIAEDGARGGETGILETCDEKNNATDQPEGIHVSNEQAETAADVDLELLVEDESILDDEPVDKETSSEVNEPVEDKDDKIEEGQIQSPPRVNVVEEDTSRQVEGTKQVTRVIAPLGDRPAFDIKVVSPVLNKSKPIKLRKRTGGDASTDGKTEEEVKQQETQKKRKWLSAAGEQKQAIVISTDVLKGIMPDLKDGESSSSWKKATSAASAASNENTNAEAGDKPDNSSVAEKEEDNGESVDAAAAAADADMEAGEVKCKHAPILFSSEGGGSAAGSSLKPVRVLGNAIRDTLVDEPVPRREGQRRVPDARNPLSPIVHVMKLTRPFTVPQLKTLLARHGQMVDEEFWIDDIKSQCYVKYKTKEAAEECRRTLFGCKWPKTNPKPLVIDFVSQAQLDDVRGIRKPLSSDSEDDARNIRITKPLSPPPPPPAPRESRHGSGSHDRKRRVSPAAAAAAGLHDISKRTISNRSPDEDTSADAKIARLERRNRDREHRERGPGAGMNGDWVDGMSRREQEMRDSYRERRDKKRQEEAERLKHQKEEPPVKLLDDLFRKTKAEPAIYWLPLTSEQMVVRDRKRAAAEMRELQELEEDKKNRAARRASSPPAGGISRRSPVPGQRSRSPQRPPFRMAGPPPPPSRGDDRRRSDRDYRRR